MRTTLNLDEELVERASDATGVREKTALLHLGLRALIQKAARDRLIKFGGSDKAASVPSRRRPRR